MVKVEDKDKTGVVRRNEHEVTKSKKDERSKKETQF